LACGYILWLGATTGTLANSPAGILTVIALLVILNFFMQRGRWQELWDWTRKHSRLVLATEVLFLGSFALWAFVRSHSPEVLGTEKPMELAFLNSVVSSEAFPPLDPWLSGHAISYYYFGYVMAGVITTITGTVPAVAFNLTSALWFALVATASYSVVYNLISLRMGKSRLIAGLLGPLFILVMGNLEAFLEILHTRQLFWSDAGTSWFWNWLDLKQLDQPPLGEVGTIPSRHWWWWRASRVVRDVNLAGGDIEVIDEFPFFSFILADIHPHVLAFPFVLLAVAFVLNLYLRGTWQRGLRVTPARPRGWLKIGYLGAGLTWLIVTTASIGLAALGPGAPVTAEVVIRALGVGLLVVATLALVGVMIFVYLGYLESALNRRTQLLAAWIFGGLAFLNAWDFPIYLSLLFFVLLYLGRNGEWWDNVRISLTTTVSIALTGILLYALWYPTFSSQASGILPNLGFPTKIQHFFVMFAPLCVPIGFWLWDRWRQGPPESVRSILAGGVAAAVGLFLLSWTLAGLLAASQGSIAIGAWADQMAAASVSEASQAALFRRISQPWSPLLLGVTVAAVWVMLRRTSDVASAPDAGKPDMTPFVLIMVGTASLLVIGPEFFYLRDLFGTRMNTIFKFYYAAWILWGLAAVYACYEIWPRRESRGIPWSALAYVFVALGLCYPVMSVLTRTNGFQAPGGRTLDGSAHLDANRPMEALAIDWINQNLDTGVVAEAVGGSYSEFARVSTYTPLTTVLGWDWHEIQWRGTVEPQGSRRADIERLYRTRDWREARQIIERYSIDFVFVGPLERQTYGNIDEEKFVAFMTPIYENESVRIYSSQRLVSAP
jgi:uncharacterized membrane protein